MTISIGVILYDKGPGGVPTHNNPQRLHGLDSYDHAIANGVGFETMTTGWNATANEVIEWARADHLKRPVESFSPDGIKIWEGFLSEITIKVGNRSIVFSLKEMSNRITIHYNTDGGAQDSTNTYSNAASIAMFGTKDRVLNISTVAPAAADNRAQTVLAMLAFPTSKEPSDNTTGTGSEHFRIELAFTGDYATLGWVLTSNASKTLTATNTQAIALLTSFNTVNNWFSVSAQNIVVTGISDTEFIDPETSYRDKLETLLAHGDNSKQRLVWGIYEDRKLTVAVWAGATPTTITYYEHESGGQITDRYGNVIEPWFIRPNAMAQLADVIDTPLSGAVESPTRKYVARVSLSIRPGSISVKLEPDNVDSIEAMLSGPSGAGPSGTSDRQASFEQAVTSPLRTRFSGTNGRVDAGGGSIGNTGGGNVDVGTGVGIGGGGGSPPSGGDPITFGVGVAGRLAEWLTTGRLQAASQKKIGAGILTFDASTDETITIASGGGGTVDLNGNTLTLDGSLRVSGTGATLNQVLQYDGTRFTPTTLTPSSSGSAPVDAKYIVQTSSATLTNEQALGALSTGIVKNTTSTGVLSIAVGSDLPAHNHPHGDITDWNEAVDDEVNALLTAGANIALTYNDAANTLTIAVTGLNEVIDDRVAALLVEGTNITLTYNDTANTLTISAAGATIDGAGAAGRLTYWSDTNTLTSDVDLNFDGTTLKVNKSATIGTNTIRANTTLTVRGTTTTSGNFSIHCLDSAGTSYFSVQNNGVVSVESGPLWVNGSAVLGGRVSGWAVPTGTATRSTFATSTVSLQTLAEHVKALIEDLHANIGNHYLLGA